MAFLLSEEQARPSGDRQWLVGRVREVSEEFCRERLGGCRSQDSSLLGGFPAPEGQALHMHCLLWPAPTPPPSPAVPSLDCPLEVLNPSLLQAFAEQPHY